MKSQTFTRKEFYDLIWSTPLTALINRFMISYSDIRKICYEMQIPIPKPGHWEKLKFNKSVEIIELSSKYNGKKEVTFNIDEESNKKIIKSNKSKLKEIIEDKTFQVPKKLINPHKLIVEAKAKYNNKSPYYFDNNTIFYSTNEIRVGVGKVNIDRAFILMDALLKKFEENGYKIKCDYYFTNLTINEELEINLRDKYKRVSFTNSRGSVDSNLVTTGLLIFTAKTVYYRKKEWFDGAILIEKHFCDIVKWIESAIEELRLKKISRERSRLEQQEQNRIEGENRKRKEKEIADFKKLLNRFKQWQESENLRLYLNKVEANAKMNNLLSEEFKEWLKWARNKVAWYDPLIALPDEFLNDEDRENLHSEKNPQDAYRYWY